MWARGDTHILAYNGTTSSRRVTTEPTEMDRSNVLMRGSTRCGKELNLWQKAERKA